MTYPKCRRPTPEQLDERIAILIDAEKAIEALMKVDPEAPPVDDDPDREENDPQE